MRLHYLKRFLRFRLWAAIFVLTLICLALGIWAQRAHRQRVAIDQITAEGGVVLYYNENGHNSNSPIRDEKFQLDDFFQQPASVSWVHQGVRNPKRQIDLAPLRALPGLRELDLTRSTISSKSYDAFAQLTELRVLYLQYSTADDVAMQQVAAAVHLEVLFLTGTYVTDRGVAYLTGFKNLRTLDLSGTDISDQAVDSLTKFTALKRLDLSETDISDQAVQTLAKCTALKELRLIKTRLSPRAVADLKKMLPNATIHWSSDKGRELGDLFHAPKLEGDRWDKDLRRFISSPNVPPLNSVL